MRRLTAVLFTALPLLGVLHPAACAHAQAAQPFEEVVLPSEEKPSYLWAYASMIAGAGMVGLSFNIADRADRRYDDYLQETDPDRIDRLYDETLSLDRWSAGTLIAGEALVALGVYYRFVHRPSTSRLSLDLQPTRCALSLRF